MQLSVVLIGHELLDGRTLDQNLKFLTQFVTPKGGILRDVSIVKDDIPDICSAIARSLAPTVVISGGLGPTDDDKTREAIATFAHLPLLEDPHLLSVINNHFLARSLVCPENNRKQAMLPQGASSIPNNVGTAPGFSLTVGSHENQKTLYAFPGVPREFSAMFQATFDPILPHHSLPQSCIYLFGISESMISEMMGPPPDSLEIGFRAMDDFIEVKVRGDSNALAPEMARLSHIFQNYRLAIDSTVEQEIGRLLSARKETLSVAESCTGGLLAAKLVEVAGASAFFNGGAVTYTNEAKVELLGVLPKTLQEHGAVSRACAAEMAQGVASRLDTSWGVSITGIAGPDGGSDIKPVGYVCFGVASPNATFTMVRTFGHLGRQRVRSRATVAAMHLLLSIIEGRALPEGTQSLP